MSQSVIKGVSVRGICSVLPARIIDNRTLSGVYGAEELEKIISSTGIESRRVVAAGQTCLDLAKVASLTLLKDLNWLESRPELIIFVTQTPDFVLPGNAIQLQNYLDLPKSTVAFDVNLGCSGFIYGLWLISQLLLGLSGRRAFLVVGDTASNLCAAENRSVALLFGDAVSVIAIEKNTHANQMCFSFGTDGAGAPYLIQPFSAAKTPDKKACLQMDGTQVFVFTLREIPKSIHEVLKMRQWSVTDIDYAVLHQANSMMLKHLGDKLGLTEEQLIISMQKTGNTSSASIPLAMSLALAEELQFKMNNLLLSGFGVGWSWASVALRLEPLKVCKLIELTD